MKFDPSSATPEQEFDPTTAVPEEAPPVRAVLQTAVKQNPDQTARATALGKQYGVPTDVVVRNLQNVELQAAVDKADERLKTSPKLAAAMRKRPEIAPLAHDDIEPLAKIESNFAQIAAASVGQAVLGISEGIWRTPDAAQRAVGYLAEQVERTGLPPLLNPIRGVQDVIRFVSEGRVPAVGTYGGTTQLADKVNDAQKVLSDRETFGNPFADVQTLAQNADKALATAVKTGNLQQASQVLTDPNYWSAFMAQAIPSLYAAMKSGGSTAFMAWMEGMEQAGNAAEFEKKTGIKISDTEFTQAVAQTALVNALLEKYGLDKVLGAKGGGIKGIAKAIFAEGGTEGLQQINSNLSALLAYNPEQSLSEGVLASIMGGAGSGGGMSTAQAAAGKMQEVADKRRQQATAADTNSNHLAEQLKAAGSSALRERSPEQFRALMGEMTDGKIYVDGQVLNQLPEDVKASLPQAVQDQIATAAATGDVVEISTADALTVAPGTALEEVLVEHARTDPFAMSKADAAEATKLAQSSVMNDAQRLIQQAQDTEARQAEYDAIHKLYADQLNAAARFRPQVNEAKAHWLASFYTTMAARSGMTPAQFQAAHPVSILGAPTGNGQPVMDQGKPGSVSVEGYHFSAADRSTLTTGAFGTGLRGSARDEIMAHPDARLKQRLSFYVDLGNGIVPESGVGGRAHRAQLTNVYDSDLDPLKLRSGNARDFEVKLLDAGYSGYLTRMGGASQGQVIMLGQQTIQPELLGAQSRITNGQRPPALPQTEPQWTNYATGTPEEMQAQLERMQAKSSWQAYDMRVEGNALQYRKATSVYAQESRVKDMTPAVRKLLKNLTPIEQRKVTDSTAAKIIAQLKKLPPAKEMAAVAFGGKAKRGWYKQSAEAISAVFQQDGPRFAALLAATSPQCSVETNLLNALNVWKNWIAAGRPTDREAIIDVMGASVQGGKGRGSVLDAWINNSVRALTAENPADAETSRVFLSGPKVNSFFLNLIGVTDEVTNDAWMANYALVDQVMFSGSMNVLKTDPGKGSGYLAMAARTREAAAYLTKTTGETWTPAEVQETVWSWAKTLYEMQVGDMTATRALSEGLLTDDLINSTPDFSSLFNDPTYGAILKDAGYGDRLDTLGSGSERTADAVADEGSAAGAEADASAAEDRRRLQLQAARRLERLREQRAAGVFEQSGDLNGQAGNRAGRYSSGGLAPLEGAPAVAGATGPDARLVAVAEQYAASIGVDLRRQSAYATVDPERAARIAAAYEAMPHAPNDPAVKAAYDDLIQQTTAQYLALKEAGYQFWFMDPAADPYQGNPWNAMRDLRANQSMAVFPTEAGFGTGGQVNIGLADPNGGPNIPPEAVLEALRVVGAEVEASAIFDSDTEPTLVVKLKKALTKEQGDFLSGLADQEAIAQRTDDDKGALFGPMAEKWGPFNPTYFVTPAGVRADEIANPLLQDTGITWAYGSPDGEQRPVLANDLFRAVHDAFGHGLEGAGFRAQGEENAWQAHRAMFTGPALGALTSETRGQNSWLNYGPHGESNKTAKVEDTVFAEQKTGLMPEWTWTEGVVEPQSGVLEQGDLFPGEFATKRTTVETSQVIDSKGTRAKGGNTNSKGQQVTATKQGLQRFWDWFAGSEATDDKGRPLVLYHSTNSDVTQFETNRETTNSYGILGEMTVRRAGIFLTPDIKFSQEYLRDGAGQNVMQVYAALKNPLDLRRGISERVEAELEAAGVNVRYINNVQNAWELFDSADDGTNDFVDALKAAGYDGAIFREDSPTGESEGGTTYVAFEPSQVKSATGNQGTFDANDPSILSQAAQTPRGTFNPATLELVLNPNANLSTFFHETGHFFLEVMADIASQPNAPVQIAGDFDTFLAWANTDRAQWAAWQKAFADSGHKVLPDGLRAIHERWAESIEQYVMEGKAPSVELQPLMRRFATWLKSVYGSIQKFLAARGQAPAAGGPALNQVSAPEGVLTDDSGKPLVLYHSTPNEWAEPKFRRGKSQSGKTSLGFHFGTREAANDRVAPALNEIGKYNWRGHAPTVLPVYLKAQNVVRLRDIGAWHDPKWVNRALDDAGIDAQAPTLAGITKKLKALGYDGVVYENTVEAPGSTSYIVFDPKQIVSAISGEVLGQDPNAQPGPPMALNDDIRRVMDRMLATDEQIAQANEVAGLVPDLEADAAAQERLNKRSMADLKWAVRAYDEAIKSRRKEAKAIEKDLREQVTVEVDQTPEMRAKRALDALSVTPEYAGILAEHKAARKAAEAAARDEVKAALYGENPGVVGLFKGQLLAKNRRDIDNKVDAAMIKWDQANPAPKRPVNATDADVAVIADSFGEEGGWSTVDEMLQAIDAFGSRADAIDGLTEQRMLEEHGDLIDERAIQEAANEAVHNEARARSLASELRTQREMLNPRQDTGQTSAKGSKITVNALVEAAKQFAANVVARTTLRDLTSKAWQHTAAERRAAKRWQEATAAGKTQEAVQAKQDQMLNHAAAKAAIDARAEAAKIFEFFKRVTKGNDETVVEKGRDPDIVNAARATLAAYGVQTSTTKRADDYLETLSKNDPETYNVILPMVEGATRNAQPLDALTFEELQALHEEIQAMWFLAKRSRQMEVDGDLLDVQDVAEEVYARLEEIGIPDTLPGETGALTDGEIRARRWLQQVPALLRRVEQWAEAKDGKFGGPFSRFIFGPVKTAADAYRTARVDYRKRFQALVDNIAPMMPAKTIAAPELGYVFGRGHNGIGMAELLHAIAHTGNESNKRKLLLGRGWATDNGDGTIDTSKWDAFIARLAGDGTLQREHFDFVQGVWDLMEQTKPLAQQTHRAVFGRYFAEVTADAFVDPFGVPRLGGYIPAQADPLLVQDADLRELLETDNAGMSQAFPATNKGFTKGRVEYNRPLKLDLRTLPQHIDKVLLFSHMEPAVRGVARLLRQPKVSQPLARVDPAAIGGMLKPWLNRSARQTVETPVSADAGLNRVLSTARARVGMALMFANVSNTLQQITGFSSAALKVKPSLMMRAAAQFISSPKKFSQAVHALSPYMADRASNEVSVLSDTMEKILINPGVFARAESWTRQHAYFLQTAMDNVMGPIIWTGAYNQAVAEGMDERMAIRYADGVIRQTQGSTLPEDVSRIETGPAYARVFTQFISYFNMLANTNGTALQQIAQEQGLKKGAGKAFGVVMLGLLVPIWVAEAIANGMRGGPDDEDDDGYLDDWLAAVFGFGTIRGLLSGVPFVGAAAQSAVNRFNSKPADDKFSLSPTVSVLESAVGAPASVYGAIVDDKNAQKAVRDVSALITVATGLPAMAVARPLGYVAGVADNKIQPTGPVDAVRGLVTGTASPESKQR